MCKMNILGIETSSAVCSVGLVNDRGLSIERNIFDPHIHSEKLLTLVEQVLRQAELEPGDLDAVAVSIGPGSFTGLRIGLSSAKGLCYALNKKLIAVSTFEAIARAVSESRGVSSAINIVIDAKQGEFYFGSYDLNNNHDRLSVNVHTRRLEEFHWSDLSISPSLWVTDRPEIIRGYGISSEFVLELSSFCRGDSVARLGSGCYERNEFADLAFIVPVYLKEFIVKPAIT
jgi:tRNA threonylcarbamoyladenosine biosynthesis protein TsaB